jgi:isopentenyl-diphosphate Delta-isomerase
MQNDYSQFEQRKRDHIELALMPENQSSECNPFDALSLTHEAIPDFDFADISIESTRLNQKVAKPFLISSMTAGHEHAPIINRRLLEAASIMGWSMGVGSQRRELTDKTAAHEWGALLRDVPHVSLFGNLGIAQLITTPLASIQQLIDSLKAKGLIIHCNPLQECIQPEGTPQFAGAYQALSALVKQASVPIIVKETGCGFSKETLTRLDDIGISAVDVSGLGGTHWGRIEGHRAAHEPMRQQTAHTFRNWGIDTISSIKNAQSINPRFEIWGSGGVRQGLDAAKLFALGATTVGFAKPMLVAALQSTDAVIAAMTAIEYELKTAMFCTGSNVLTTLKEKICL